MSCNRLAALAGCLVSLTAGEGGAESWNETSETDGSSLREAWETYDSSYLWFEHRLAVEPTGAVVGSWSAPIQGMNGEPLDPAEFYERIGGQELASRYRSRRAWKRGLQVGGVVAGLGGLGYLLVVMSESHRSIESAEHEIDMTPRILGLGLVGAGVLAATIGSSIDLHPISTAEARVLADEYNRRLKRELGLEAKLRIQPGFAALPGGGGLTLFGTF